MKSNLNFLPAIAFFCFIIIFSCMEEPLNVDLENANLQLDTLTYYDITGQTYQVAPVIGSKTKMYLGENDGYSYRSILISVSYISNESYYTTLSTFLDTTVKIDSAFFTLFIVKDSLIAPSELSIYYFPDQGDSIFSESETNYLNFTENEMSLGSIITSADEEAYEIDSVTIGYKVKFPVLDIMDSTFADTSMNYTFMLTMTDSSENFLEFYSREYDSSQKLTPKLELFFRDFTYPDYGDTATEVVIDTLKRTFYASKDLNILTPPDITEQDTVYMTIGSGKGLRSFVNLDLLDSVQFPKQTSFDKAELTFYMIPDTTISTFSIWAVPMIDTVELSGFQSVEKDDYSVDNSLITSGTIFDGKLTLNIKNFIQNYYFDNVENRGLKLYANINNNLQSKIHFYSAEHDSLYPRLNIRYVYP